MGCHEGCPGVVYGVDLGFDLFEMLLALVVSTASVRVLELSAAVRSFTKARRAASNSARRSMVSSLAGGISGGMAQPNRASMVALIGSVLARVPVAWAKRRICSGVILTLGSAALPSAISSAR